MIQPPQLPRSISPDGRELWDWAAELSNHTELLHRARTLRADIFNIQQRCGSCGKWMISRSCPRETHNNTTGRNTGPSCNGFKCNQFSMSADSAKLLEQWGAELDGVMTKLGKEPK